MKFLSLFSVGQKKSRNFPAKKKKIHRRASAGAQGSRTEPLLCESRPGGTKSTNRRLEVKSRQTKSWKVAPSGGKSRTMGLLTQGCFADFNGSRRFARVARALCFLFFCEPICGNCPDSHCKSPGHLRAELVFFVLIF